ncbi:MAG: hypothetical protein J5747_05725 [Spirochaetaceae bacterium]|nr:hypothetical protein [Spirochaetaceae bacterium]
MHQEDYSKLINTILTLSFEQRLSLLSVLANSLQQEIPASPHVTVSSIEELHQKLDEGLADIEAGRVVFAKAVHQNLL